MEFPWSGEPVPATETALYRALPGYAQHGLARYGPDRVLFSADPDAAPLLTRFYNTPLHEDDLWVVTMPKCGTTWAGEMAWLIRNDLDWEGARSRLLVPDRMHFLEWPLTLPPAVRQAMARGDNAERRRMLEPIDSRPRPWQVQSHLPLNFLPPQLLDTCKVLYVARNPKDACVSFYNMLKMNHTLSPETTVDEFASLYCDGNVIYTPYFPHVLQAWRQRTHTNLLFLTFEEMKQDLRGVIRKVAEFLGKSLTEEQVGMLEKHLHFDSMRDNPAVNNEGKGYKQTTEDGKELRFMRKGKTGDWKNHLSDEVVEKMDRWMEENLRGTGLQFVTEIEE